jgi:hypothetical protein
MENPSFPLKDQAIRKNLRPEIRNSKKEKAKKA